MKKSFSLLKFIKYTVIIFATAYILFNSTARRLLFRYIELYKLQTNMEEAVKSNEEYKKRLYYLQTKPVQMDRIVKEELEVIAEDEIEYRFED